MISKKGLDILKLNIKKNLNEEIQELNYLGRGACNDIFYVKTISGEYSIKQERLDKLDTENNNLEQEFKILKIFKSKKINLIPEIIYYDSESKSICYKYIKGDPLDEIWITLSENDRNNIMIELGKLHYYLHSSISIKEALEMKIGIYKIPMEEELSQYKNSVNEAVIETDTLRDIIKKIEIYLKNINKKEPILGIIHGDLHQGNILVVNKQLSGIVDFGDCVIGDIERDFNHYARHYPDYLDIIIESYEKSSKLKLNRDRILLFGLLTDIKKVIYHVDKYKLGKEKLLKKMGTYFELLNNIK